MRTLRFIESVERRVLFATVVPSGFTDELYTSGVTNATAMEFAPDGRLFVLEQFGNARVIDANGTLRSTPFITLTVDSAGERGLLGIAFDPAFQTNGYVYLYYTVPNGANGSAGAFNRLSRFTAVDADPGAGYSPGNTAVAGSEQVLLNLTPLSTATNHNGGALHFGPDGKLYLSAGENANGSNSQTLNNFLGKILRINPDGTAPSDNPFNDHDATPNEPTDYIWALGLRNPYTTAFDPVTGRFHINDVGQDTWEEIDLGAAGANYGWPTYEGPENDANFGTPPIFSYSHSATGTNGGNVISGATFYRPAVQTYPDSYAGDFFFEDAGRGWIKSYDVATGTATVFATGANFPVDLKTGADGSVYYLERGSGPGSVRRIRANLPPAPSWLASGSSATWNGSTLTVTGTALINADPGADAPQVVGNTAAANLSINPTSGTRVNVGSITLTNGARIGVTDAAAHHVVVTQSISIDTASKLDLTDNDLIVDYSGTPGAVASSVEGMVRRGFGPSRNWLGTSGITSSTAAAVASNGNYALGVAENALLVNPFGDGTTRPLFSGQAVDGTAVLVKFTYRVDLNLDGRINSNDAAIFNGAYNAGAPGGTWMTGDVDYDGTWSSNDAAIFNSFYNENLPPIGTSAPVTLTARPRPRIVSRAR